MNDKDTKAINRIDAEIAKIDSKESNVYFYVIDTKGNASGSLEYVYKIAKTYQSNGYNVTMLYMHDIMTDADNSEEKDPFVGVGGWLGDDYASIPHKNIVKGDVGVSPSDVLFIPEIFVGEFSSDQEGSFEKLPCKKVMILQNYGHLISTMPVSAQLGKLGIMDCVCNTEYNKQWVLDAFPYLNVTVVNPYIDKRIGCDISVNKRPIVNIYTKDPLECKTVMYDFYRRFPTFQWVSFKPLNGMSKDEIAKDLRNNAITVWLDTKASFGYTAIEAMKSGSIVIAKVPENPLPWISNGEMLNGCCVWFENPHDLSRKIAECLRGWMTDSVPEEMIGECKKVTESYSEDIFANISVDYLKRIIEGRRNELVTLKNALTKKK